MTFEVAIMTPEGITQDGSLEITLPEGLSVEELVDFEIPEQTYFDAGSNANL